MHAPGGNGSEQDTCFVAAGALSFRRPLPAGTSSLARPDGTLGESKVGLRYETLGALLIAAARITCLQIPG